MNVRKRRADDSLLPLRAPKIPRTTVTHHLGGNPSPNQDEGLLARWTYFFSEGANLMFETANTFLNALVDAVANKQNTAKARSVKNRQVQHVSRPSYEEETRPEPPTAGPSQPSEQPQSHSRFHFATTRRNHEMPPPPPPSSSRPPPMNTVPASNKGKSRYSTNLAQHVPEQEREQAHYHTGLPTPPLTSPTSGSNAPSISSSTGTDLSELDAAIQQFELQRKNQEMRKLNGKRRHIYDKAHKAKATQEREKLREELQTELYNVKRASGYGSNFEDFKSYLEYSRKLDELQKKELLFPARSMVDLRKASQERESNRRHSEDDFLARALEKARLSLQGQPPPGPFTPTLEQLRVQQKLKDAEIEQRLHPKVTLPESLPPEDEAEVDGLFQKRGVISRFERSEVTDHDLQTLRPGSWLNDEIINFYGQLIQSRSDEALKSASKNGVAKGKSKPLNVHYFNSFFWTKLKTQGYEKGRLAKWTKKIDIFSKDVILLPVNHNNTHWTAAAINFRQKRIESYDSMDMNRSAVFQLLRSYLDAEHRNKKKKPFDFTGWEDYVLKETPQQENGYDCGVFTCQFLESLSRGVDRFAFRQRNMPYLRRRMAWEIAHCKLRDDP
ncbi:cysteine proteinase [Panus rudis PR-1116 ss-1]|nr:cysteine proteinase [Panus rudis PR-1116 ss-1]